MSIRTQFHKCLTQNFIKYMEPGDKFDAAWTIRCGDESETHVLRKLQLTLSWVMGSEVFNLSVYGIIFWMTTYFKRLAKKTYKKIKHRNLPRIKHRD